ncbi:putative leucine-rich repeat domain superfamily [Helianthus anomalus]
MDEIWERAMETALDSQRDTAVVRTLTLDGAVKCVHGRFLHPSLFQKFPDLQQLSIANIGVSSLEQFPRLQNLQKLTLSDNEIAGGLEILVQASLEFLVHADYRSRVLGLIKSLKYLDKMDVVENERPESDDEDDDDDEEEVVRSMGMVWIVSWRLPAT